jgi:hypothetical protein
MNIDGKNAVDVEFLSNFKVNFVMGEFKTWNLMLCSKLFLSLKKRILEIVLDIIRLD